MSGRFRHGRSGVNRGDKMNITADWDDECKAIVLSYGKTAMPLTPGEAEELMGRIRWILNEHPEE